MELEYRYEQKYLISKYDANLLKNYLNKIMTLDKHSISKDISYHIRSLYFDDLYNSCLYDKVNGEEYRGKYRIRIYNQDDSLIKLELKRKDDEYTNKQDCILTRDQVNEILKGNVNLDIDNKFYQEFKNDYLLHNLKPSVIVDYDRLAYTYDVSQVRITFDYNIRSGINNTNLFDYDYPTRDVLDKDKIILEVKCNEFIPSHIMEILSNINLQREAFSKFAYCKAINY